MKITGIHHIELTVTNLKISKAFYEKLPSFKLVAEYPDFVMFFVGNAFYLGLTDHKGKIAIKNFSEFNVGLDHVAFEVDSLESLSELESRLTIETIPHEEIETLSNGTSILVFRDPDNIQLEFAFKAK